MGFCVNFKIIRGGYIMNSTMGLVGFGLFYLIFMLGMLGISIYGFVLFVKLANRGIKALDIYINEKSNRC